MRESAPLLFKSFNVMSGTDQGRYVIGTMFTEPYREKACRLAASCQRLGLPYQFHEVPFVHNSMSVKGGGDLSYTKANFVRHLLDTHKRPVLYVDADCEIMSPPVLVD